MAVVGDWQEDASEVTQPLASSFGSSQADLNVQDRAHRTIVATSEVGTTNGPYQTALTKLWQGQWSDVAVNPSYAENGAAGWEGDREGTRTNLAWTQIWVTSRPDGTDPIDPVASTQLPETVYANGAFVDPDVISVEWEPATTPIGYLLVVDWQHPTLFRGDLDYEVKWVPAGGGTGPYVASALTSAQMAALPTLSGAIQSATNARYVEHQMDALDHVAVIVADELQLTAADLQIGGGNATLRRNLYHVDIHYEARMRPRYRLTYTEPPPVMTGRRLDGGRIFMS